MFVQIHTLRDYSTALPNRGQDGLAKRTVYGGIERQRISSQSFKAAMRDNLDLVRSTNEGKTVADTLRALADELGVGMSVRSALIADRIVAPKLKEKGLEEETAQKWAEAIMGLWRAEGASVASDTPLVVGQKEIDALVDAALALQSAGTESTQLRKLFESARGLSQA